MRFISLIWWIRFLPVRFRERTDRPERVSIRLQCATYCQFVHRCGSCLPEYFHWLPKAVDVFKAWSHWASARPFGLTHEAGMRKSLQVVCPARCGARELTEDSWFLHQRPQFWEQKTRLPGVCFRVGCVKNQWRKVETKWNDGDVINPGWGSVSELTRQ